MFKHGWPFSGHQTLALGLKGRCVNQKGQYFGEVYSAGTGRYSDANKIAGCYVVTRLYWRRNFVSCSLGIGLR